MNRAKIVVLFMLGGIVLGLTYMLYSDNLKPIISESNDPVWQTVLLPAGAYFDNIAIDPKNRVWISGPRDETTGQRSYLAAWDGENWQEFTAEQVGLIPIARDFDFESTGRMWIAVPEGAAAFDGTSWSAYAIDLNKDNCEWNTLVIDRNDRVWLGGAGCGVVVYDGSAWIELQTSQSFGDEVSSLAVDPLGRVWVGTYQNKGLFIYDGSVWTEYSINEIPYMPYLRSMKDFQGVSIRDIVFDTAGRAWLGTNVGLISMSALAAVDGRRPDWRLERAKDFILDLETDASARVYAKLLDREGIIVRDAGQWKDIITIQNNFGPARDLPVVQALALHPNGRIWISADDFSGKQQRLFNLDYDKLAVIDSESSSLAASDRLSNIMIPSLIFLLLLWLAALRTRPVGSAMPVKQKTSARWMSDWVLVNSLTWLTVSIVMFSILYWLGNQPSSMFNKQFMLWMPGVGVCLSMIWAAGQWMGMATVLPQAGRWSVGAFIGTLAGFIVFYASAGALLAAFEVASAYFEYNIIIIGGILPFFLPVVGAVYIGSLGLVGLLTGWMNAHLLAQHAMPIDQWASHNAINMMLGGVLGPIGGILYGAMSGKILQTRLFGDEKMDYGKEGDYLDQSKGSG